MSEKNKYLLKGDVSGIQEYIFNVQSKGAAKSLKAKSYYISIVCELCYRYCIKNLENSGNKVETIYSGGGNFFVQILGQDVENELKVLQAKINQELIHDEIAITLTLVPVDEDNFGKQWMELLIKSNKGKLNQQKNNYPIFEPYYFEEKVQNQNRFAKYNSGIHHNDLFKNIVDKMVKSQVIETRLFKEHFFEDAFDFENRLANKLPFWKDYDKIENYKKYRQKIYDEENGIKSLTNIIDFDAFGDFAANRTGTNKLAVLKMDVDNLGLIFRDNISSLESAKRLSVQFQDFFDKQFYEIWEVKEFKSNIYPVFVGGDDCFIVGSWDKVLPFAKSINDAFQEGFQNRDFSLSAGIIIVNSKHPVISFAELVEEALSNAKNKPQFLENLKNIGHKKNSVCLFSEIFSWKEFDTILEMVAHVKPLLKDDQVKRSILDKIRNSASGFRALQQQILEENHLNIPKLWRLKYYLGKKMDDSHFQEMEDALFKPYENALISAFERKEGINPAVFPVAARLIELSTKKELEYV